MPAAGQKRSIEHTFTFDEVRGFAVASGDHGLQHVAPDSQGRLMVHGLLLGTLPTQVGGEMNFVARTMEFEFLRPVFTGDSVRCEVVLTQWEPGPERTSVQAEWECRNQRDETVMRGRAAGIVRTANSQR